MKKNPHLLPRELLESLKVLGDVQSFNAGELLIREGDTSTHLYILLSGQLKVFTSNGSGRELIYNTLDPGEYFGELALDGGLRSASVRAVKASQCVVITEEAVRDLVRTRPEFVFHLITKLMRLLRRATQKLKSVAWDDVYERVISLIHEEMLRDGEMDYLPRTFTQQEIANRIGATREMVNHVLRDLIREGFIAKDARLGLVVLKALPR